jgi:signal transduction histidine kinase
MHPPSNIRTRQGDPFSPGAVTGTKTPESHKIPAKTSTTADSGSAHGLVRALRNIFTLEWVLPPGKELDFEEVRKRKIFATLAVPGSTIPLIFGLHHLFNGNLVEGTLDLIGCLWLVTSLLGLRMINKVLVIYRVNTIILGLLFLFLTTQGGTEGHKLLWMFSYPMIAFYTLGLIEGLIFTTAIFVFSLGILFLPMDGSLVHTYSMEFRIRYSVAFVLVATMTYIYESVHRKSQSSLENERNELEAMTQTVQAANRALTQSEQRLKQAQSIARVGNFEYDIASDQFWGSDEALRIFGFDRIGGQISAADLKDRAPSFYAFAADFENLGGGECKFSLEPLLRSNTQQQETMVYAKAELLCPVDGRPEKVIGVIQDITTQHKAESDRKALEAKLVSSQKMESLGLLAGGVAHDLNNVLSGIVSYPDVLLQRLPADSDLIKPLSAMRDSGLKAAAIVQDLLTLARRGVTNFKILDLNELIDEYLQSPELEKLKSYNPAVEIKVNNQEHLLNIKGSAIHLKKTLMNLVSNAAEALPDGGRVQISTQNRYIDRQLNGYTDVKEGEYVLLSVEDNGIGIQPDDLARIFEPFYTKKKMDRSGTGLGLAVVWGTVEDHHGYINVTSNKDKGTLIELYLPVTRENLEHRDQTPLRNDYYGNGERILVVDDFQNQREITSEMLTELGYRVETVGSGEEALAVIRDHDVDLVVIDMIMDPGIDGLETYSRLRALRPEQKTLIVSGFSETRRVKEAQRLGAGAYVKKPYSFETIGLAVRRELNR